MKKARNFFSNNLDISGDNFRYYFSLLQEMFCVNLFTFHIIIIIIAFGNAG
jgi:hypothetical protein